MPGLDVDSRSRNWTNRGGAAQGGGAQHGPGAAAINRNDRAAFKVSRGADGIDAEVEENLAAREARRRGRDRGEARRAPRYFCILGMRDTDRVAAREKDGAGAIQEFSSGPEAGHGIMLVGGSVPLECADPAGKEQLPRLRLGRDGLARYEQDPSFRPGARGERFDEQRRSKRAPTRRTLIAVRAHRAFGVLRRALSDL